MECLPDTCRIARRRARAQLGAPPFFDSQRQQRLAPRRARHEGARLRRLKVTRTATYMLYYTVVVLDVCVRGRAGRNAVRGLVSRQGLRMINVRLGGRVNRTRFRGSWAISYRGRHAAVVMTCARPTRGTMWATTWARILDHCADMNGAPLTRTPPRPSWGRGPPPSEVAANSFIQVRRLFVLQVDARVCVCLLSTYLPTY